MALLDARGLGLTHAGRAVLAGADIDSGSMSRLAIVADTSETAAELAAMFAGLSSRHAGTLRLDGTAYPTDERQLARFRSRLVGFLTPQAGEEELHAAVAHRPRLLVCLEPGADLAGRAYRQHAQSVVAQSQAAGIGLLVVTREIRLAADMAEFAWVVAGGRVAEKGPAAALAERPGSAATRRLVAATKPRTRTMARPPIGEPLLVLEGVGKRFTRVTWGKPRKPALDGIDLTLRRGEALGVLGATGSGKSVLLRLMAGLMRCDRGRLVMARAPYGPGSEGGIAMLFPDPHAAFNPDLPVGVTLAEPMRMAHHLRVEEQAERLVDAVRAVGLVPELLDQLPAAFPAAQLQRLALARALVGRPRLVLLDEPTLRLDPVDRAEFVTLFARVRSDYGLTTVHASRQFELLRLVADRLAVLDGGRIVETGTPAGLLHDSRQPATQWLVTPAYGAVASADGTDEGAKGGKLEHAVGGSGDRAGRVDAADGEARR